MNESLKKMQEEYSLLKCRINKNLYFSHSMIEDEYKILCADFFSDSSNCKTYAQLAEESLSTNIESELAFLNWINKE